MFHHRSVRIALVVLVAVVAAVVTSIYFGLPATTARSPEAAVELFARKHSPASAALGFTALHTHIYDEFAVVLYHWSNQDPDQHVSYHIAYRVSDAWYTKKCCDSGGGSLSAPQELTSLLRFTHSPFGLPRFVYGRVLIPDITAVEATFADNQTIRVPVNDGFFIVLSATSRNICALRALGSNGLVLGQSYVTTPYGCESQ